MVNIPRNCASVSPQQRSAGHQTLQCCLLDFTTTNHSSARSHVIALARLIGRRWKSHSVRTTFILRPMLDTQQSRASLSCNFVARQSCQFSIGKQSPNKHGF